MSVPATGSDTAFRSALVTYFSTLDGLEHVYRDMPMQILRGQWPFPEGSNWKAVAFVHIEQQTESRISVGGQVGTMPTGQKQIDRKVALAVVFQWALTPAQSPSLMGDEWVQPIDDLLSEIKALIRADPTLGTGSAGEVFQAGQNESDIRITRDTPRMSPQRAAVILWTRVEFDTTTIITA